MTCACSKKQKEAWEFHVEASSKEANEFLHNIYENKIPEWVLPLEISLPPIPESLHNFVEETLKFGVTHSYHEWLEDKLTIPPSSISQYVSGSDKAQRFKDCRLGSYFASLFHIIQLSSCTEVELVGWDLYHGHVFLHTQEIKKDSNTVTLQSELGILFHAKEFPKEYGTSKYNPIYPIGHIKQGGEKDPRHGTKVSIKDEDFHLRNYIWLSSTNKIYLLDPTNENFDKRLLCSYGEKFQTCSWKYFTSNPLGDINYFPSIFSNEDVGPYYQKTVKKVLKFISNEKQNGISPKEILHNKLFNENNKIFLWYVEQIGRFIRHSSVYANDLFFCPFYGFSIVSRLYDSFLHNNIEIQSILSKVEESALNNLLNLIEFVRSKKDSPNLLLCEKKVITIDNSKIIDAIHDRKLEIIEKREEYNKNQRIDLLSKNVDEEHADIALKLTSYQGLFSSYKSFNLLSASLVKYRSQEDIEAYGNEDYSIVDVFTVMKHTFYSWSTLYALKLQKDGISLEESIELAQKASHNKLHESLQKSLDDYDPDKEAEYYAKLEAEKHAKEEEEKKYEIEANKPEGGSSEDSTEKIEIVSIEVSSLEVDLEKKNINELKKEKIEE